MINHAYVQRLFFHLSKIKNSFAGTKLEEPNLSFGVIRTHTIQSPPFSVLSDPLKNTMHILRLLLVLSHFDVIPPSPSFFALLYASLFSAPFQFQTCFTTASQTTLSSPKLFLATKNISSIARITSFSRHPSALGRHRSPPFPALH